MGSSVGFVGSSGCGKSTILQLIQRFYDPTDGHVKVGGVNLTEFNVTWWRRQVGFVGQEPVLFDVSIEENVRYGKPEATREELDAVAEVASLSFLSNGKLKLVARYWNYNPFVQQSGYEISDKIL